MLSLADTEFLKDRLYSELNNKPYIIPKIPLVDKILSIGISESYSLTDSRKVRLSNLIAILGLLFSPFYIYLTIFTGRSEVIITDILSIVVLFIPLIANRFRKYMFARYWIVLMYPILILKTCVLVGTETDVDLIFIVLASLPLILFDRPSRYAPLALYVILLWAIVNFVLPEFEPVVLVFETNIVYINEILVFTATLILFWQFKYQVSQFSKKLLSSNQRLQSQIEKTTINEKRFRTMAENIPNGSICIMDENLQVIDAAGQEVNRYSNLVKQQVGKNIKEILGLEEFQKRKPYYDKALNGEMATFESSYLGDHYINSVSPILHEGDIKSIIISSLKITDIKRTQEELDRQKQLTQNIFDNAPMLISVISEDGRYITVNRQYEDQFDLSTDDIVGMHYSELLKSSISEYDIIGENMKKTIRDGRFSYTYELDSPKTGQKISLLTIYTKLQFEDKPAVMIMAMNVTAQRQAEIKLKDSLKQLNDKNEMISDSINYALRIQQGVLDSSRKYLNEGKTSFIYFKPKDILSGDFFWAATMPSGKRLIIAADATGHGVPGAMLTLIGTDYLNEIIYSYQIEKPDIILQELDRKITQTLAKGNNDNLQDGMDMAVVLIDEDKGCFEFSAAKSPVFFVKHTTGQVIRHKGNKYSIGGSRYMNKKAFTSETVLYDDGDMLYLGSDGYTDQFGGENQKKLGKKRLMSLVSTIWSKPLREQNMAVENYFQSWKGDEDQIDDVLFMGIRLTSKAEKTDSTSRQTLA